MVRKSHLLAAGLTILIVGSAVSLIAVASRASAGTSGSEAVARARAAGQPASSAQQLILSDGHVSWDEHEAAIRATSACLSQKGVVTELRPAAGKQPSSIGFSVATIEEGQAAEKALADCKAMYLDAVEQLWLAENLPSRGDVQNAFNYVAGCMQSRGHQVRSTERTTPEDVAAWQRSEDETVRASAFDCISQRRIEFGY